MRPATGRLWAPWRAEYIYCAGGKPGAKKSDCLFCRLASLPETGARRSRLIQDRCDQKNLILWRGELCFVLMNRFPYNNGHVMIVPYKHVATFERLSDREGLAVFEMLRRILTVLRQVLRPHGFNIGANLGRVAGAGVAGHVHLHVVPRWQGDSNFMPLLAETKVISEHLANTYARLRGELRRLSADDAGRPQARAITCVERKRK